MGDLEYVIWFLLNQKKFEVSFRRIESPVFHIEVVLAYWCKDKQIHQYVKWYSQDEKLPDFLLLTAMAFESELRKQGLMGL